MSHLMVIRSKTENHKNSYEKTWKKALTRSCFIRVTSYQSTRSKFSRFTKFVTIFKFETKVKGDSGNESSRFSGPTWWFVKRWTCIGHVFSVMENLSICWESEPIVRSLSVGRPTVETRVKDQTTCITKCRYELVGLFKEAGWYLFLFALSRS